MYKNLLRGLLLFVLVAAALPVLAVKYGVPDNGEHPYVGLVVFYNDDMVPQWRCTATLISPTVLLTAAHCSELEGPAQVWFQEDVTPAANTGYPVSGGILGEAHAYPGWEGGLFLPDTGDVGVVVLDTPVNLSFYPQLAPAGYLDGLATKRGKQDTTFEVVGYGLQSVKPELSQFRLRLKAVVSLVNLKSSLNDGFNIQTSNNPGQGHGGSGGTCFGDSGGPIFTNDGQHLIVAVNSFVLNENCAGSSFGYRVDRTEVINWVYSRVE